MGGGGRLLVGLATFLPLIYLFVFFAIFLCGFFGPRDATLPLWFFAVHVFVMLPSLILMVVYILDVFRNDQMRPDTKVLWTVVLLMGNTIAMPIYWLVYVRSANQDGSPVGDSAVMI